MMPVKKSRNPFYLLLVPVGAVFVVTAFAYGIMAFQSVHDTSENAATIAGHPLFQWLRMHGDATMLIELAILGALTFAAIATDRLWDKPPKQDQFTPD